MKTKLIMVEGIPGSGKSTIAQKIADHFANRGVPVSLFNEGHAHPADLAWNACVPLGSLDGLLTKYHDIESEIRRNMTLEGEYAVIAYAQVKTSDRGFYNDLAEYEIYDARVPSELFNDLLYSRWGSFGKQASKKDVLNIFECAFLQNNVGELMNFRLSGREAIEKHLNVLLKGVETLSPVLIYLSQPQVSETLDRVIKERVSPNGNWIDSMIEYFENTPYGQRYHQKGLAGVVKNFEVRQEMEMRMIESLPIDALVVENRAYDWDQIWQEIETFLYTLEKP